AFIRRVAAIEPQPQPLEPLYLRPPDAKPQKRLAAAPPAFTVQPATAESAALFASLHAECFDNPWSTADMARLLAMPGAIGLLASQNADPCAFLLARRVADEAEILTLGTRPFARRRGAAKVLIERLQSEIAQ